MGSERASRSSGGADRSRLGFLYPGYSAEDDYPLMRDIVAADVEVEVVHTAMELDAHEVDALLQIGGSGPLLAGAEELRDRGADVVVWACTSGSFVFGRDGARRQVEEIAEVAGVPASSTSWAFVNALATLGLRRVAIAATYPPDIASAFAEFLAVDDVETVAVGAEDILTAAEVGTLDRDRVLKFVVSGDTPDAEAVLVPDTALHTAGLVEDLEASLEKPVLTANQVTMWEALGLVGKLVPQEGFGTLFRSGPGGPGSAPAS